ncbi:MAG: FAD-binding protein, partial [Pseudomonadota bacterium]
MGIEAALLELSGILGDRLSRSKVELATHGHSESHFDPAPPDAVAFPETTDEVSRIVEICGAQGVPVLAFGAGTALEGHTSAYRGGVSVDFRLMNKVLSIHPEDLDVTVQPGLTREELNRALRETGLFFPIDPGANASLGGMAACRASGTTAVRYGTMRENVLGLEIVLGDGRVIRTGTRARKSASGYDLTGLMVGSEGTLGLITELTLKLYGRPEAVSAAVCGFPTVGAAVEAVIATIQVGLPMARIELLDAASVAACNAYAGADYPELPHLFVEFHGSPGAVAEQAALFGEIAAEFGMTGFEWSTETEDRTALWTMRHNAYYAVLALRPGARAIVTDVCVPISQLAEAIAETSADIAA